MANNWEKAPLVKEPWESAPRVFDFDFGRPVEQVRADIGKLPEAEREDALRQWADAFVAKERKEGGFGQAVDDTVRTLSRGTFLGSWLDEANAATSAGLNAVGLGGAPYDEAVAYQRAKDRAFDRAHPVLSTTGQIAGGLVGGGAALRAPGAVSTVVAGPLAAMTPAATMAGRIGQAGAVGGIHGAAHGAGAADPEDGSLAGRAEGALKGAAIGAPLGLVLGSGVETVKAARTGMAGLGRTGAYDRMGRQLPDENIDTFANQVATGSGSTVQATQRRTLDLLGQEMQRAGGDRGQAVQSTVARLVREDGIAPSTAQDRVRRLVGVHSDSELLLSEYPAVAASNATLRASARSPGNIDPMDVARVQDSGAHMVLDDLANQAGARSNALVRNVVTDRNLGMRDAMGRALDDIAPRAPGGGGPMTIEDTAQMIDGARRAAQVEYQRAYQAPTNNGLIVGLLPRIIQRHQNRMQGRAGEQYDALNRAINEFMITRPNGQRVTMMDMQMLQDARGALRAMIRGAERSEQRHIVNTLQPLYTDVTRMMQRANPQWALANRRWADMEIDRVGDRLGEAFATKAGPQYRHQIQEYDRLAPEAQDMVRVQFLQKIHDKLDNLGDNHDVAKLFTTQHMRNAIERLFGRQAMLDVTRMTRDAAVATKSGRMLGNSQTALRTARREEAGSENSLNAAVEMASVKGVRNAILDRLTSILTERKNIPLAEIATTPMRDVPEVARHIHNMQAARQFRERISRPSLEGARISGPLGSEAGDAIAAPRHRRPLEVKVYPKGDPRNAR